MSKNPLTENKMGVMPVGKLLINMALPMIISMLVQALYNVVDSIYVSRISESAVTALSLAFPVQNMQIGFAVGIGVGVNSLLSKSLGERNQEAANRTAGNGIILMYTATVLFMLFGTYILAVAGVKGSEEIHDPPAINDLSITVTQPNLFYSYNLTWTLQTNTEWYDVYRRYYSPTRGFGGWRKINISRITTNSFSKEYYPALSTNYQFAVVSNNAYGTNWSNIVSAPSVPTV